MGKEDSSDIIVLLGKYISNNISSCEKQILFDQISYKGNEYKVKEFVLSHLHSFEAEDISSENTDSEKIFKGILSRLNLEDAHPVRSDRAKEIRKIILRIVTIAASLIIVFFLGGFYATEVKSSNTDKIAAPAFTEIMAPLGSKSEISLPDGTHVILNAGSILKYGSDYNYNNRDLYLEGEAYFKVTKNIELPLNVSAGNIMVKAVGTEFNIKAYDEEGTIETTLVEGKVEITQSDQGDNKSESVDLNPNQKAIYIKEARSFTLAELKDANEKLSEPVRTIYDNILISPKVDVGQVVAWTQGKLVFRSENLENLCVELQRKYDVNFIFADEEIKKFRFSGVLLDETLEQVLNVIELTAPVTHYVEGKSVYMETDREHLTDFARHLKK